MIFQDMQSTTLRKTLNNLKDQGYQLNFRRVAAFIYCFEIGQRIGPEDFKVDEIYYFGDNLNPDADRIVYAISLSNGGRGFLIDACTVYTDNISDEMEQKLQWQYPLFNKATLK